MKKILCYLVIALFVTSCGEDLNSLTVINNSNHNFIFALGDDNVKDYYDLTIQVDSSSSFTYYGIEPGSVWLYYASMEIGEVYVEYLGGITAKDELEFSIDTIFELAKLEVCGNCTLISVDLDGNIAYGTPQFVCGDTYQDYKDSQITTTIDGQQYWDCE